MQSGARKLDVANPISLDQPVAWEAFVGRIIPTIETLDDVLATLDVLKNTAFLQLKFMQCLLAKRDIFTFINNINDFIAIYYQFSDNFHADIFAGTSHYVKSFGAVTEPNMESCKLRELVMHHGVYEGEMLGLLPAQVTNVEQLSKVFGFIPERWLEFYYQYFHALISKEANFATILNQISLARCDRLLAIASFKQGHLHLPEREKNAEKLEDSKLTLFKKYYAYPRQVATDASVFTTVAAYLDQQIGSAWFGKGEELPQQDIQFLARDTIQNSQIVTNLANLVSKQQIIYLRELGNRLPKLCKTREEYLSVRAQLVNATVLINCYLQQVSNAEELARALTFLGDLHAIKARTGFEHAVPDHYIKEGVCACIKTSADLALILDQASAWRELILTALGGRLFKLIDSAGLYDKAVQCDQLFLKNLLEKYIQTPLQLAFLYRYSATSTLFQSVVTNKTCANYFEYDSLIANEKALQLFLQALEPVQRKEFVLAMKERLAAWFNLDAFKQVCSVFEADEQRDLVTAFVNQPKNHRWRLFEQPNHEGEDEAATQFYSLT